MNGDQNDLDKVVETVANLVADHLEHFAGLFLKYAEVEFEQDHLYEAKAYTRCAVNLTAKALTLRSGRVQ